MLDRSFVPHAELNRVAGLDRDARIGAKSEVRRCDFHDLRRTAIGAARIVGAAGRHHGECGDDEEDPCTAHPSSVEVCSA